MKFETKNLVISTERIQSLGIGMVTSVIVARYGLIKDDVANTEKVRIMRNRKSTGWNMYFHKYDEELSGILEKPSYEISASDSVKNVKGSLRDIVSDLDDGLYSM